MYPSDVIFKPQHLETYNKKSGGENLIQKSVYNGVQYFYIKKVSYFHVRTFKF